VFQKNVTTFLMISWTRSVSLQIFLAHLLHRQIFLVSHLTYLVQLLYLGKLSRTTGKYHEFSLKLLISQYYNTRIFTAKLSPYYFTHLLLNLRFIIEK